MVQLTTPIGNISFNETNNETDSNSEGLSYLVYLIVFTLSNVIMSAFCLFYIAMKLTLNKFIKAIFSIMAIQNIICSTILTIIICLNNRSYWACQGFDMATFVLTRSQSVMIPLISVLRYTMASKARNSKIIQQRYITYVLIFCALFPYFNAYLNLMLNGGYSKLTYLCMELPVHDYKLAKLPLIINTALYVVLLGSGVFFDVQMILLVKKQNQTQPIQLVPWKIVDPQEKEKDMEVPLRTTIISSIIMLKFFIGFSLYLALDLFWPIPFIVTGYCIITLPLTLFFSVKHTKSKKAKVQRPSLQPPQGPHFHNENSSFHNGISHPLQFHEEVIDSNEQGKQIEPRSTLPNAVEEIEISVVNRREHFLD